MLLERTFAKQLTPLIAGGTGSASHLLELPKYMPDRFESGTLNLAGIYGLHHALSYLKTQDIDEIHLHEMRLTKQFIEGIDVLNGVHVVGDSPLTSRVSTVSISFDTLDEAEASYTLEQHFGVLTRCGLQCSPLAHQAMHTFPKGTLRFSFGYFNTSDEVTFALKAIRNCLSEEHLI